MHRFANRLLGVLMLSIGVPAGAAEPSAAHYAKPSAAHYAKPSAAHYAKPTAAHYSEPSAAHYSEPSAAHYAALLQRPYLVYLFTEAARADPCRRTGCPAIADISNAFDAMDTFWKPNLQISRDILISPEQAEARVAAQLRRIVFSHPRRMPAYCVILTAITAHFDEYHASFNAVELALRISTQGLDCLTPVIAALPRNHDTDFLLSAAAENCLRRDLPSCDRIARPLTPATPPAPPPPKPPAPTLTQPPRGIASRSSRCPPPAPNTNPRSGPHRPCGRD